MTLLSEMLDKINGYLSGAYSDDELEGWIVSNIQRSMDLGDATTSHILDEVDVSFVELGEGIITLAEFKERLAQLTADVKAPS